VTAKTANGKAIPTPLLAIAFRPFFLLAALYAVIVLAAWLGAWQLGWPVSGRIAPTQWHAHEMVFGMTAAVIAGFLLTAMSNWTATPPLSGRPLLALLLLWLAGRVALWSNGVLPSALVMAIDLAFLPAVAGTAARILWRAGNHRNLIVVGVVLLLAIANGLMHLGWNVQDPAWARLGERLGLFVVIVLIILIGGRITPAFTRNWLRQRGASADAVRSHGPIERLTLVSAAFLLIVVASGRDGAWLHLAALFCALINLVRLVGWSGWLGRSDPLIWILHIGYAWIVLGLLLLGAKWWWPQLTDSAWLHALGNGAVGTMLLGVMSRVALGHTGRLLELPRGAVWIYWAILLSAVLRIAVALGWLGSQTALTAAGLAWVLAFSLFLWIYTPILIGPRVDGRPG